MKKNLIITSIIICVAGLIIVGFLVLRGGAGTKIEQISINNTELKTYSNTENYFSFSYPSDYQINTETDNLPQGNSINLTVYEQPNEGEEVTISVYSNDNNLEIENYLLQKKDESIVLLIELLDKNDFSAYKVSSETVSGQTAEKFISNSTNQRTIVVSKNKKIYIITEETNYSHNEVFDEVVESFRLI
ncbi:MAG: PsbP-related protein [Patescibacteria group bacterium]|jgi:hypothetical protein